MYRNDISLPLELIKLPAQFRFTLLGCLDFSLVPLLKVLHDLVMFLLRGL